MTRAGCVGWLLSGHVYEEAEEASEKEEEETAEVEEVRVPPQPREKPIAKQCFSAFEKRRQAKMKKELETHPEGAEVLPATPQQIWTII